LSFLGNIVADIEFPLDWYTSVKISNLFIWDIYYIGKCFWQIFPWLLRTMKHSSTPWRFIWYLPFVGLLQIPYVDGILTRRWQEVLLVEGPLLLVCLPQYVPNLLDQKIMSHTFHIF
jgi:hypothetical protein